MPDDQRQAPTIAARIARGATAGFVAGVLASFAMDRFQAVVAKVAGSGDDGSEPATAKAADKVKTAITSRPVDKADQPLAGQIVHYALGTGLGIAYGIATEFRPQVAAGYGGVFGIGVAATLDMAVVPAAGLGSAPWKTEARTQLYSLASHLVFGTIAEATRRQVRTTLR